MLKRGRDKRKEGRIRQQKEKIGGSAIRRNRKIGTIKQGSAYCVISIPVMFIRVECFYHIEGVENLVTVISFFYEGKSIIKRYLLLLIIKIK